MIAYLVAKGHEKVHESLEKCIRVMKIQRFSGIKSIRIAQCTAYNFGFAWTWDKVSLCKNSEKVRTFHVYLLPAFTFWACG
jgi:hypothetical protein